MAYRFEVRLTAADVGSRVVIRWRRPASRPGKNPHPGAGGAAAADEVADVLGILESADTVSFAVRTASGEVVTIPAERVLAGKTVPPPPRRRPRDQERDRE